MSALDDFNKVISEFDNCVDFVTVYITEAHPFEGWTLKNNTYNLKQHATIDDRISAAEMLRDTGIACPVVMDTMADECLYEYAAYPEAMYIIEEGIVKVKCLGPFVEKVPVNAKRWLQDYIKRL